MIKRVFFHISTLSIQNAPLTPQNPPMKTITLTQNFFSDPSAIIQMASRYDKHFFRREEKGQHGSVLPVCSRFATLEVHKTCAQHDIRNIFSQSLFSDPTSPHYNPDIHDLYRFIQIQKYEPGDFIVPHKDVYEVTKIHLITLTSSTQDGLICQDDDRIVRVLDIAGQKIDFKGNAWHWVDPVISLRYSIVIGE